jgi:hypothetical protein
MDTDDSLGPTIAARRMLADLSVDEQAKVRARYGLSPDVFTALATGKWSDVSWRAFWHVPDKVTPKEKAAEPTLLRLQRKMIELETNSGRQQFPVWLVGDAFGVHRSISVKGWTLTHAKSGRRILSRIASKADALQLALRLLSVSRIDWTAYDPILPDERKTIFTIMQTVPLYRGRRSG